MIDDIYKWASKFTHLVIDTKARPEVEDIEAIAEGADFLILPTTMNPLDIHALIKTIQTLQSLNVKTFKVLLTKIPPQATTSVAQLRKELEDLGFPVFRTEIKQLSCLARSPIEGILVKDSKDRQSKSAWKSYMEVGKEIVEDIRK